MRVLLFIVITTLFFSPIRAQKLIPDSVFLQKAKNQRLAGFITLGCGLATALPGFVILSDVGTGTRVDIDRALGGVALLGLGTVCIGTSIGLFIASGSNQKKAYKYATSFFVNEPVLYYAGVQKKYMPYSVGVRVPIR